MGGCSNRNGRRRMHTQHPIDEALGMSQANGADANKAERYFKDLERAIATAVKAVKHSDDQEAVEAINNIDNECGWASSYVYDLIQAYDDVLDLLDEYRSVMRSRLTEDEQYELNAINVRNKLEAVK